MTEPETNSPLSLPAQRPQAEPDLAALTKAVRRLTIAVWVVCGVVVVAFAAPWLGYLLSRPSSEPTTIPGGASDLPLAEGSNIDNDFHARPVEEQVQRATAILLTQRREQNGRHVQVVTEVLKRAPNVRLYYGLGEEVPTLSHAVRPDCDADCEGEGQVVFMTGNPATMTLSMSFRNGRVGSLGDMPLTELRALAANKP